MKETLPTEFESATHRIGVTGECVKATRWAKDGDHPLVVRYPIDGREYKGLLVAGEKTKFALRFGDWILEDAKGQVWVESQVLPDKYKALKGGAS